MKDDLEKNFLLKFQRGNFQTPTFDCEEEKKIFLQLQKYSLIYMTPKGVWTISRRGREALDYGAKKFLTLERFEERLIKDSYRRGIERKWLYFAIIPLILLLSFSLFYFQFEI